MTLAAPVDVVFVGSGDCGVGSFFGDEQDARRVAEAERAGGSVVKPARATFWGGYSGYFADPEGYLWEVATGATKLPFAE